MIPLKESRGTKFLKLNDFSGGVNFLRQKSLIKDNQLSDINNMWFKDGALKTRPALVADVAGGRVFESNVTPDRVRDMNTVVFSGERYILETVKEIHGQWTYIFLRLVGNNGSLEAGEIIIENDNVNYFSVIYKDDIYVFVDGINKIYRLTKKIDGTYNVPQVLSDNDMYAPLVLTNCWACFNDSGKINAMLLKGASYFQDFNLLSNRYRMKFSQYDAKDYIEVNEGDIASRVSYMEYGLPFTTSTCQGKIYLEYTCVDGLKHYHEVQCPRENAPTVESGARGDDLYLHAFVKGDICHVTLNRHSESDSYLPDYIGIENYVNNNLEINAPRDFSQMNFEKLFKMSEAVWYGNNSLGVNGGSRLFLGGNESERALLLWSDFENPLYFPEENYAYVGDKSQKITAFARQGSSLIIFKEREIYSTQYMVAEGEATDARSGGAYFPMVLVHPTIGCNFPETVQLLRNHLVFMGEKGKIYTLTEQNQYSERNVYMVSQMVEPHLKEYDDLHSVDWQGYYLLFCKNTVFVMDYNSYGYVNIHSSDKESTANMNIPWYKWQLPVEVLGASAMLEKLKIWVKDKYNFIHLMTFDEGGSHDEYFFTIEEDDYLKTKREKAKINVLMETKHFDFEEPHRLKTVERIFVDSIKSHNLTVTVITDDGFSDSQCAFLNSIVPFKRIARVYGIRFEGEGRVIITGVGISFRYGRKIR